ncbi:MAG: SurA N-terminal domain-containing protein [Gammaproteobacteria bacterium]|jgi:peptidyl-prolyl cis-trans isomerase D|nr:SurA N-terminal domain-containing protein [Gammaproteobacteria bacterium]MDP6615759.1 SurA N-terminal domain-containing protein [Gammaproteobacteria bacterium]MDP6695555.1 SurA N-terminal domain-containing protein [Gammaproteobacteria bacterium]
MLQIIRDKFTGWVAAIILGVVALALVLTFGNVDTGFLPGSPAASVNGDDIPLSEFRRIYNQQRSQWEQTYRTQIPAELAENIANSAIQTLVRNKVLTQHVEEQGYRVSDAEVIRMIEQNPAFQVGGSFSRPAYKDLLRSQGLSEQLYEYDLRHGMEINQFVEGIGYTAFYTPAEFRRYIELDGESRAVEYLLVSTESQLDETEVSEEEITGFFAANEGVFQTDESVSLNYIEVNYDEILAATMADEADALAYYEDNPDEFSGPAERSARHILIAPGDDELAAAGEADELYTRLLAGEDFTALAAEYSDDTGTAGLGGELGWFGPGDSPAPEFEEALFALAAGEVSAPVKSEYGFHIIRLDGIRDGAARTFAEVRDELLDRLRKDTAMDQYDELLEELDDRALESLAGLEPVAEAMGLTLGKVAEFTRNGGEQLVFTPELVDTVFSIEVLEDGENSRVIETEEGRAVVVQVVEHRLPATKSLDEVREQISVRLQGDAAAVAAAAAGEELLAQLNAGGNAETLAREQRLEWIRAGDVKRASPEIQPDLVAALFAAPKPGGAANYAGMVLASRDYAVYRVTGVTPGKAGLYSLEDRDTRKQQLAQQIGAGQITALVENLVNDASVTVTSDLLGTEANLP